jgi:hypothetical protein
MADNYTNILVGPGVVSFAPYPGVASGPGEPTPGTFTDVGAIVDGVQMTVKRTYYKIKTDHLGGIADAVKVLEEVSFKFKMQEFNASGTSSVPHNALLAFDQIATNYSGTFPAQTISRQLGGSRQLYQMKVVISNLAASSGWTTATATCWRTCVTDTAPVSFKRDEEAKWDVTVDVFLEPKVTTAGTSQDFKLVFA